MWFAPDEAFAAEQRRSVEELQEESRGRWDLDGYSTLLLEAAAMRVDTKLYIHLYAFNLYLHVNIYTIHIYI